MKQILIIIAALAALSACKTVPPPDMCSELTSSVPGEENISKPSNAREEQVRAASICAIRACRMNELADFHYRGSNPPSIWYFVDHNEQGLGKFIWPKYYQYMGRASSNNSKKFYTPPLSQVIEKPPTHCPEQTTPVMGEERIPNARTAIEVAARDTAICAARACKVEKITRYKYRS